MLFALTNGEIVMPDQYSDGMVIGSRQEFRGTSTCPEGSMVTATFDNSEHYCSVCDGKWSFDINDNHYRKGVDITFEDCDSTRTIKNVAFGYIFLCSGQSNMYWPISKSKEAKWALTNAHKYPNIRVYKAATRASRTPLNMSLGTWNPQLDTVSALCYYTAVEYIKQAPWLTDVAIGLYDVSKGGSAIQEWNNNYDECEEHRWSPYRPMDKGRLYGGRYNAMLAPLRIHADRFIWYQGEANNQDFWNYPCLAGSFFKNQISADSYTIVGLAGYYKVKHGTLPGRKPKVDPQVILGYTRRKQLEALEFSGVHNYTYVNNLDLGDPKNIHPLRKLPLAKRIVHQWTNELVGALKGVTSYTNANREGYYLIQGNARPALGCRACCKKASPIRYRHGKRWYTGIVVRNNVDNFLWRTRSKKHRAQQVDYNMESYMECVGYDPVTNLNYMGKQNLQFISN